MDVDYSVCEYYDFDVWLPISGYNKNNYKKKPPILSESKFAQNECWSDALESYLSFRSLAWHVHCGADDWDLRRNRCGSMEALYGESIKRSEGWNFYWDFYCDLYYLDLLVHFPIVLLLYGL